MLRSDKRMNSLQIAEKPPQVPPYGFSLVRIANPHMDLAGCPAALSCYRQR
jgi:hypothetical protein